MRNLLSVIVPCYNEEKIIGKTAEAINSALSDQEFDFELIFVNDGSKDDTLKDIKLISSGGGTNIFRSAGISGKRRLCWQVCSIVKVTAPLLWMPIFSIPRN